MKYFNINGLDYHCSDVFNWVAIDKNSSVYLYEEKPFVRVEEGYWTGGYYSQDLCVIQKRDYYPEWLDSLKKLTT